LRALGRQEEAGAVFAAVIARFPGELWAHYHYARLAADRRDWTEALTRWDAMLGQFPDYDSALLGKARTLYELDREGDGEAIIRGVLDRDPFQVEALVLQATMRDPQRQIADEVRRRGNAIGREFTITYRDHLEANEHVIAGAFWAGPAADAEVSVEKLIAERARLHVGDTMRFDVLGRVVSAKVTSIRDVEWRESRNGGFVFVFRPGGVLGQAPQTFVAPLKGPDGVAARARFQHDLVEQFPNVSVIDFHEVLETVRDVMSKVTLAITVVGGLVLFSGGLILIGAVAMTKFQRVYEAAVFKTLGANTRTIARMLLFEYGVLGSLAGLIGSLGAIVLTWGVSRYALEIPWRVFAGEHIAGVLLTSVLVAVIGVVSSLDVLKNKPLATLRAE